MLNIRTENLTKRYGPHVAVDSVTIDLGGSGITGLLGPNGAGKTTFMRMITGAIPPSEGKIFFNGTELIDAQDEVKRKIGYLPEQPPVYPDLTVKEYLMFVAQIRGIARNKLSENVQRAAELCGIADKLGRLIGNLSKGYRQRVGLAQALVHEPEILILDEPTVGLDPRQIIEIRNLIKELGEDRTVVLSTHILQEVTSICQRVAIINNGRLVAFDYIDRLTDAFSNTVILAIRVRMPESLDVEKIGALNGVKEAVGSGDGSITLKIEKDDTVKESIAKEVLQQGAGLVEMKEIKLTLEDIFLKVVSGQE